MEECESLDSEMTELQEFQGEASETISQDDEDEMEELQNSLREVVQDQSVKPKLQCLHMDPSFSMVTVQSEDSGIVWETASSRCSTPWASETSSVSEAYSMEGSGAAGKITIVFDEEKVIRRRVRSGGRSRLGDRLSRPGSSRSASALGVERPEMAEVSIPNVKQENKETEPDQDEIKNKDQQLFSLISEGYEILNIRVPSKLPTVDEEESTELQDNLSYLDQTPMIKSQNHHDWRWQQNHVLQEEQEIQDHQELPEQDSSTPSADAELRHSPTQKENIDYFEKFTLVDVMGSGEQAPELQEGTGQPAATPKEEEPKPSKDTSTDSLSASDDSFVFVADVEIAEEHLDEVFYGEGAPADALRRRGECEAEDGAGRRMRWGSQRSLKESGSVLFESEETILTPIYIPAGPPKIIDPILLEEPTAMSFMYSDLYEDAVGERRKSDEDNSEAESVASGKSYERRFSDSEEADGYLEKFTLKDETPTLEVHSESVEERRGGRMTWSQSKFQMTGCLQRVVTEDDEKTKKEQPKTQQTSGDNRSEDLKSVPFEVRRETDAGIEQEREEVKVSQVTEEQTVREALEESMQDSTLKEDKMGDKQVKHEMNGDQTEPLESSTDEALPQQVDSKEDEIEHRREELEETFTSTEPEQQVNATEETAVMASVRREEPHITEESEIPTEANEESLSEGAADIRIDSADEKVICEVIAKAPAETSAETPAETSVCETKEAAEVVPEDVAPVEVITDSVDEKVISEVIAEAPAETSAERLAETSLCETKEAAEVVSQDVAPVEVITDSVDEKVISEVIAEAPAETSAETTAETSLCETKEAAEVLPEDVAPVEVITDCDSAVHAVVEIFEKAVDDKEMQTQVQIDLQEAPSAEASKRTAAPEEEHDESPPEESAAESQLPDFLTEADQESGVKTEISSEVIVPVMPEDVKTESKQHQQEESVNESEKTTLIPEAKDKTPVEDTNVCDTVNMGDELILLVPKGQAVEMDIEFSQWSEEKTTDTLAFSEPDSTPEHLIASETTTKRPETPPKPSEETMAESQVEMTPEVVEEVVRNELDNRYSPSPSTPVEEANTEVQRVEWDRDKNEGFFSPLRSFTPQQDLSGLHREDLQSEAAASEQKAGRQEEEDASPEPDLHREDVGQKMEQHEAGTEAPEVSVEEVEYEVISEQDAKEMLEPQTQRDAEEPKPESGQEKEERAEIETETEDEDKVFDLSPEEEPIEADYEIIDAEEERLARLAAELEGLDWFCLTCGCLLSGDNSVSGEHHGHEVTAVDKAYEETKEKLSDWIAELQGRSENIEDLVSEIELAYNSIEDQCVETEAAMQAQNEEMMALVMDQYNSMSISLEEEKKAKLEQLYDQIVSFQDSIDSTKATLETTAREAETEARSPEDIHSRLKEALDSVMSLELGPKGLLVFEDYAKGNTSGSHLAQRKGIPVPQRPSLQPQEPGSATSTVVAVYWRVNAGDIIDCFQVYCMEDPQGAVSEEYRVTVKESHCVLEELEPDKTYKVWVMAVNYTGCSLPSERLAFRTAPSVPVIDTERCTVMGDSATLRWSSTKKSSKQSYTLEYCRQYELEGEGLRSITGINGCEQNVLLQPNENYLFYIKAVNEAGASEQSEAALVSTKGTRFHLLEASAHPALELSVDQTTLHYSHDASEDPPSTDRQCPSILGELLLAQGRHYWETIVSRSTAYRLGVAYSTANRHSPLGEDKLSWCLQRIPTPSGYQLLHNDVQSSLVLTEMPERVGTLLDYQLGHLSFYNAQSGQLLGTFRQRFTEPCHPALGLESPGSLEVRMVPEAPQFTKDS